MKFIIFLISAYIAGFLSAVPAGPVQIEVVRRAINGHLRSSLMVILGALTADIAYGIIAFFGIAPYLKEKEIMAIFWLAGAAILLLISINIIRQNLPDRSQNYNSRYLKKKRWALIGGFSLSAANPMMILWWLIGLRIFMEIKLIDNLTPEVAISFLAAGGSGLASYLVLLSIFLFWAKRFISENKMRRINLSFGITLFLMGIYFVYSSITHL
jgi:threonine/homoserine/homoserine lactone efflux protein